MYIWTFDQIKFNTMFKSDKPLFEIEGVPIKKIYKNKKGSPFSVSWSHPLTREW